jgi:dGTPase
LADDIAYDAHDIDDGLRAGLIDLADLDDVPFLRELIAEVDAAWPGLERARRIHEVVRRVITRFVEDAIAESGRRLDALAPDSAEAVRRAGAPVIAFSLRIAAAEAAIKKFLFAHVYRHPRIAAIKRDARGIVSDLFARYAAEPALMAEDWGLGLTEASEGRRLRRIADFIAGMTDRYAIEEHRRLFDATPELR